MNVDCHASCELLPVIYTSAFSLIIPDCFSMSRCANVYLYVSVCSAGTWQDPLKDIMSSVTAGLDCSDRVTRVSGLVLISLDFNEAGIFRWVNICYHIINHCSRNDCLMKRFVCLRLRLFRLAGQFSASRSAWADRYIRDDVLRKFAALQMPWRPCERGCCY